MNEFIKNNKEILITLFCIWVGTVFSLAIIKLSSINEKLSLLNDVEYEISNLKDNVGDISFHLRNVSDELSAISSQLKTDALSRMMGR
jgi:hypothetical protein